jgi:hypothetical protein
VRTRSCSSSSPPPSSPFSKDHLACIHVPGFPRSDDVARLLRLARVWLTRASPAWTTHQPWPSPFGVMEPEVDSPPTHCRLDARSLPLPWLAAGLESLIVRFAPRRGRAAAAAAATERDRYSSEAVCYCGRRGLAAVARSSPSSRPRACPTSRSRNCVLSLSNTLFNNGPCPSRSIVGVIVHHDR